MRAFSRPIYVFFSKDVESVRFRRAAYPENDVLDGCLGALNVGVLGYLADVGCPHAVLEAGGACERKPHFVEPEMLRQLRLFRPRIRRVEAMVDPELHGFRLDVGVLGDNSVWAAFGYEGDDVPDLSVR